MSRQTDIPLMFLVHIISSDVKVQTQHNVLFLVAFLFYTFIFIATENTPVERERKNYCQTVDLKLTGT